MYSNLITDIQSQNVRFSLSSHAFTEDAMCATKNTPKNLQLKWFSFLIKPCTAEPALV